MGLLSTELGSRSFREEEGQVEGLVRLEELSASMIMDQ